MPTLTRLPRPLRWLLLGAAYLVLGLIALVALVLVAINVPVVSNAIARQVTTALEPSFKGRLVLHRLGHIDFGGVLGAEVEVFDPAGNSVLRARDVDVRMFWPGLVWRLLTDDSTTTTIGIERVAVDQVHTQLVDDGSGAPTLAQAFEPRQPEPEPADPGATILTLDEIRVRRIEVRGALASPGPIDADLANLEASLESRPEHLQLLLQRLDIDARRVPQLEHVTGQLTADITLPAEAETPAKSSPRAEPNAAGEQTTTATYALRPEPALAPRITAAFAGELGDSPASAQVRMLGEELRAELEAPALSPATLQRLAPGLAPKAPAALVAKLDGALSDFGFDARVTQNAASVDARGRVRQANAKSTVEAHVDIAGLDLAQLLPDAAKTDLNLGADARMSFDAGGAKGDYSVVTKSSRFGAERLPPARARGEIAMPSERPVVASGTLNVDEPGAPTEISYRVEAADAGTRADVSLRTKLSRPARLSELAGGLSADGELTARAEIDSASERVEASFELDAARVKHPQLAARRVRVKGNASGDIALPKLDVTAQLDGVSAAERKFASVRAAVRGTPSRMMLSARADGSKPDSVVVTAAIQSAGDLVIQRPEVTVIDPCGTLHLEAERVAFPAGKIQIDRLTLDGPGRAELTLRYGASLEQLTLETERLEPARVLDIIGVKSPLRDGQLDVRAEVSRGGAAPNGKLELELTELAVGKLRSGRARAELVLDRGKLSGNAEIELARGAKTAITVKDLKLPQTATEAEVRALTGEVSLDGELDLKQLQGLASMVGLERAEGKLRFDVALQKPAGERSPTLRAHVETKSLVIVQERPEAPQTQSAEQARSTSPMWLRGIDLELDAVLETERAEVQGRVFDGQGDVVRVSAEWKSLGGIGNLTRLGERVRTAPFSARVEVPPRAFDKFPAPIRPTEIAGVFSFGAEAEGTLVKPSVRARGRIERFGAAVERRGAPKLDLELGADYAQTGGSVRLRAHDRRRALFDLHSRWEGDAALLASQADDKSPITGRLGLELDDFPIEIVPALENRQIRGKVSGNLELEQLGRDASLSAALTSRGLRIDRLRVGEVKASVQAKDGQLGVEASVNGQAGRAEAKLETGFIWQDRLVPELEQQLTGMVRTEDLRLGALQPLVEGSVSELDGKLDADVKAVVENGQPRLSGQMQLEGGVLHVPSIGQQFHDMNALVKISADAIVLENLKARGTSGGFEADAKAKLEGLTPVAADLSLRIDEDDKLPLTVEGEAVGDGWGTITAHYDHDEANKRNMVRVGLEKFNVELPQAPPKGIQDLSQPEHVRVGFHRRDGDFVVIPLQPLEEPGPPSEYETVVVVELGSVRVEKGQQAEVTLGGEVRATLGEELDVQGKIEARRGELDISGKKFDIERATVTFTGGKPDDPTISAVARYDSPAGYTVYAEYTGTVTEGKLRLSSEPPLSQDEILTLLLFGTPDGSIGAGSGGDQLATAVSVAGGTAAQGLNRALSDVTDLDVSARIDTSTGAPRPELVLQLSSRVAARVTQALGEPTPGQSPDRTFVTIELRLASSWSLSTMIGDRGASAVDLIWRRRY